MGTTSSFFGGSSGGGTATGVVSSNTRIKGLTYLGTTSLTTSHTTIQGGGWPVAMNDTHFAIFQVNSSSSGYVKLFSVDDNGATSVVSNSGSNNGWTQIGSGGSVSDMDGISCGNGYRSVFIGYRNASNNRMLRLDWDGSTGISTANQLNRTGTNCNYNNASCFVDGTMVCSVHDQGGNIYYQQYSISGDSGGNSSGLSSANPSNSYVSSVGMEEAIWYSGRQDFGAVKLHVLNKQNGIGNTLSFDTTDIQNNDTNAYQPDQVRISRAGNGVVLTARSSDSSAYGAYTSVYATSSGAGSQAFRFFEAGRFGDTQASSSYKKQSYKDTGVNMNEGGSFCRQYNGVYTDRGKMVDFPVDTKYGPSYPFRSISPRGYTTDNTQTDGRQCVLGNKLINLYRTGASGSHALQADVFTIN
jgi:hypothetical protein